MQSGGAESASQSGTQNSARSESPVRPVPPAAANPPVAAPPDPCNGNRVSFVAAPIAVDDCLDDDDDDAPIEVDDGGMDDEPETSELFERGAEATGLEVDDDVDDEMENIEAEVNRAESVYAMSLYPGVQPAFQVERPYANGRDNSHDGATIDSSRTLYAEDIDWVIEHGRQYCGDYFMPVDQTEQTRQYVIHQVYLKLFDLELTTVPLDNPRYILDIGTGIGEWAIGMAEKYPQCEVFGTDIAPIQPTQQVPFNIEFHIENAEDEWIRPADTVDLVHLRNMEGAFSDWSFIYQQAFHCIKPGGWIEVLDYDDFFADRNFLSLFPDGSPAQILTRGIMEAAEAAGRPRGVAHLDPARLREAGFVDIKETVYDLGMGSRENTGYGKFFLFTVVTGIEPMCLRPLTRYLGWDEEDVRELCEQVAQETKMLAEDRDRVESFVVKLRVVVGRKPLVPAETNGEAGNHSSDENTIGNRSVHTMQSEDTI